MHVADLRRDGCADLRAFFEEEARLGVPTADARGADAIPQDWGGETSNREVALTARWRGYYIMRCPKPQLTSL
jgi:hypothetical protein